MVRIHYYPYLKHAGVVELVDTPGLGPGASSHTGSSPVTRTFFMLFLGGMAEWLKALVC